MNVTDPLEGFKWGKKTLPGLPKKAFRAFPGWGTFSGLQERNWEHVRAVDRKLRACLAWGFMLPRVGFILRQFQFMAILFLWLLVFSIGYHFVMIIYPFGFFFLIHGKGANIPLLRAVV